jgi:L,D-transpeptidase ErfK/SrfK
MVLLGLALLLPTAASAGGDLIGAMQSRTTTYADTLLDVAHDNDLGLIELMSANPGVDPWLPGADRAIVLPNAHILPDAPRKGIVVNTAELRLYYYGDPSGPKSFPIGVGREGYLTPHGTTTVVRKKEKPNWYLTPSEIADNPDLPRVIPPGPDNPLGSHALYLGWPTYLIHGTNTPWGVGRRVSRGCIRMYEEDIAYLFRHVEPGTAVNVVDQPVKLGRSGGELFIEVEPSAKQVAVMEETSQAPGPAEPLPLADWADRILLRAGADMERLDWPAIEKALADRQGYPVQITRAAATGSDRPAAALPAAMSAAPPETAAPAKAAMASAASPPPARAKPPAAAATPTAATAAAAPASPSPTAGKAPTLEAMRGPATGGFGAPVPRADGR